MTLGQPIHEMKKKKNSTFLTIIKWLISHWYWAGFIIIFGALKDLIQLVISVFLYFRFDHILTVGGVDALIRMNTLFENLNMDTLILTSHMNLESFSLGTNMPMDHLQAKVFMPMIIFSTLYFFLKLILGLSILKRRKSVKAT